MSRCCSAGRERPHLLPWRAQWQQQVEDRPLASRRVCAGKWGSLPSGSEPAGHAGREPCH